MPLDPQQLDGTYDPDNGPITLTGPGPKPAAKKAAPISLFGPTSAIPLGGTSDVNVEKYTNIPSGVYSDQDINTQRADNQGILSKIGHEVGNLPGNIIGSFMEGIGDLGLLAGQYGDDKTYTNGLIEAGKALHDATGEVFEKTNHDSLGSTLSDPGWWINQVGSLAEFTASYAALGAGVAGILGKVTEGVAGVVKAGELGGRIAAATSQLGTAGFMAYTMGANSAAKVFQGTYETQFQKAIDAGLSPEDAKNKATHIAAQSAATTAQLTTAIGTGLALTGMGAYFRESEDITQGILEKESPMLQEEKIADWAKRIKALNPDTYKTILNPSVSMSHKLLEMGKMGVELQQLQFGEKTGEELGKEGKTKGFIDQFGEFQHYFDRTMDKDGALAFAIGAVSGMAIDKVRNSVIPSRWAEKLDPTTGQAIPRTNASGEEIGVEKQLYTPKKYSELHTVLKFTSMRDAIASDISGFDKAQQEYLASVKAGDPVAADRAASNMYNVNTVNGITNGMGEVWKQTYASIANMAPEEAVQRGFTKDASDLSYQDKANKAIADLGKYQKMYDDLQQRYGTHYEMNQGFKPVVDGVFARKVHLDQWDQIIKDHEERLKKVSDVEDNLLHISDPDLFEQRTAEYARTWEASRDAVDKLKKDHKTLSDLVEQYNSPALTQAGRDSIAKKMSILAREYQAIDVDSNNSVDSIHKSLKGTVDQIQNSISKHNEKVKQAEDNMINSSTYQKWLEKHPDGKFQEYYAKVQENIGHKEYAGQIALSREKWDIANENLAKIQKEKNLVRFSRKYSDYMKDEVNKSEEFEKQQNKELADRAKDHSTLDKAQRDKLNEAANRYGEIRDKFVKSINDNKEKLESLKNELAKYNLKDYVRGSFVHNMDKQRHKLEKQIASDIVKAKKYDSLFNNNRIHDNTNENPVNVDSITSTPPNEPKEELPAHIDTIDEQQLLADQTNSPEVQKDVEQLADQEAGATEEKVNIIHEEVEKAEGTLIPLLIKHGEKDADLGIKLNGLYTDLMEHGTFSYDALNLEVMQGLLTQEEASNVLQAMKEHVEAIQKDNDLADMLEFKGENLEVLPEPEETFDGVFEEPPSDPPIVSNSIPINNINPEGDKTVNVNTIANSTQGFNRDEEGTHTDAQAVNNKTNLLIFKPNGLTPGTRLRYEVDTEYNGAKTGGGTESFEDYSDEKGKVPSDKMGNAPIKIVDDKSGETVGYIRKHEWVIEKEKGNLKNIAEKYNENGDEVNGPEQSKRILDIRKEIVDKYNASGEATRGKVDSKGVGHIILNQQGNKKVKVGQANDLLPDPKLEIVVFDNGSYRYGKNSTSAKNIADTSAPPNGTIHALVPGANGQHIPVPLIGRNLGEGEVPHRTISRALELYLSYDGTSNTITDEIHKLEHNTGFDVSSEKGLRNFINQYFTYTQKFQDTAIMKGKNNFLFGIWDKIDGKEPKGRIKIAFGGSGADPVYAELKDGKLNPEFADALKQGLAQRSKAVVYTREGVRGINERRSSDNPFKDAIYTKDGKWSHPEHADYNDYVKSFSKTSAYGKNKLSDGSYVYVANPSIAYHLDSKPNENPALVESNDTRKVELPKEEVHYNKSLADEFDNLFNAQPQRTIKAIGSRDEERSQELTLENLEKLRNLLPEEQRNGRVPSDILRELQDRGHNGLSDGYNPFSLCL